MKKIIKTVMTYCGIVISYLILFKNKSGLFFFFPFYHTGGAEKVHAYISHCFADIKPWIFFTDKSTDANLKPYFVESARLIDIWPLMPAYSFLTGLMTGYINRHEKAVVFGCNNPIFYSMVPYLKPYVRRVDLLHAFGGGMEDISLRVVPCLDARVVITAKTVEDYQALYRANGIDLKYAERIVLIENKVDVPERYPEKSNKGTLRVMYVGRGTEEKRVHLVGKVATICIQNQVPAEFVLIGDAYDAVAEGDRQHCRFMGKIANETEMLKLYRAADILLLTSSREGMPMVIMESMAYGVVPVCTNVGGISLHVKHGVNGMLVDNGPEIIIVEKMAAVIKSFVDDKDKLARLSYAAYDYARDHFQSDEFCRKYRQVILG